MSYSIIRKIQNGSLLEVMIVVTPAAVAISAAMSFVSIPPVPRLDPNFVVLTVIEVFFLLSKIKEIYADLPSRSLEWNQRLQFALHLNFCEGSQCRDHRRP